MCSYPECNYKVDDDNLLNLLCDKHKTKSKLCSYPKCDNEFYKNECLIPVFTAKKDTPFIWKNINDTLSSPDYPFDKRKMRQALNNSEYIFLEDGNVYICSAADLLANTNRLKEKSIVIENSFINSIQIDSEEDLDLCRFLSQKESISKWMTQIRY